MAGHRALRRRGVKPPACGAPPVPCRGPLLAVVLAALCALLPRAAAYSSNPFQGQGVAPEGNVKLYYTLMVERILNINQQEYTFEAIVYVQFTWKDPRAVAAIEKFSKLQNDPSYNQNRGCLRYCDNSFDRDWGRFAGPDGTSSRKCCDGVWLPTFAMRNLVALPASRNEPLYLVKTMADNETVAWRLTVHGVFVSQMNFVKFPFDTQKLLIILSTTQPARDKIQILPSSTAIEAFVRGTGDDLSGWKLEKVSILVQDPIRGDDLLAHATPVNPDDPAPLTPTNATEAQLANADVPQKNWYVMAVAALHVRRMWEPVICMAVLPPCFLVYISLLTLLLGPTWLSKRLSVYVNLILALVALQFVISRGMPESSYLLPTTKLILLSYGVLGLLAVESAVVYIISMHKALSAERRRFKRARARLRALKLLCNAGDNSRSMSQAASAAAAAATVAAADGGVAYKDGDGASDGGGGSGDEEAGRGGMSFEVAAAAAGVLRSPSQFAAAGGGGALASNGGGGGGGGDGDDVAEGAHAAAAAVLRKVEARQLLAHTTREGVSNVAEQQRLPRKVSPDPHRRKYGTPHVSGWGAHGKKPSEYSDPVWGFEAGDDSRLADLVLAHMGQHRWVRRWVRYWQAVLNDEDVASLIASRIDLVFFSLVGTLYALAVILIFALPGGGDA